MLRVDGAPQRLPQPRHHRDAATSKATPRYDAENATTPKLLHRPMKAIVQTAYGGVETLKLRDIARPNLSAGQVLVKVMASSVHPDVWHVLSGLPYVLRLMGAGLLRPKQAVPGTEVAGVVEAVGCDVTQFKPGDRVFGETIEGMQWMNGGAFAEFATAPEGSLVHMPADSTFEQAAAVPTTGLIAMQIEPRVKASSTVLVNGAGGGVGSFAVQLANAAGAVVTGVDRQDKLEMVRSLGADQVIDFEQEDFTQGSQHYDLIFDVPGNHTLAECKRALTPNGRYILIGHDHYGHGMQRWFGLIPRMMNLMARQRFDDHLPDPLPERPTKQESLKRLADLMERGLVQPFIDQTFPLAEVPNAMRWLMSGNAKGKIVITVG